MSMQDRMGLHTFQRGDIVKFLNGEPGEPHAEAVVFGCIHKIPEKGDGDPQERKILVLWEQESAVFFLGTWPAWRRTPRLGSTHPDFNCDDDDQVRTVSTETCKKMCMDWASKPQFVAIDSQRKAVREATEPPPALKFARAAKKRAEAAAKKQAERDAAAAAAVKKKAERDAAAAAAAAARKSERGRGKGSGAGGKARGAGRRRASRSCACGRACEHDTRSGCSLGG